MNLLNKLIQFNKLIIALSIISVIGLFISATPSYAVTGAFSQTGSLNFGRWYSI
jgi:hypothetical protein